jgi:riboflavin synthase
MFTGIVQERGRVVEAPRSSAGEGARIVVGHSEELGSGLDLGASLSVAGVCLTVVAQGGDNGASATGAGTTFPPWSAFDLSPETLSRTTLGALQDGDEVNLEAPLAAGDPLGGHLVQGHVDATTRVANVEELGENRVITFVVPQDLVSGMVEKGSVTIDGVSLTIAALDAETFDVALIPHTLEVTTLSELKPGDRVNVEGDVLARYVQKSVEAAVAAALGSSKR